MEIKINLKSKKISNVSIGDYVYCYDEYQEKYGVNEVNNIFTPTIKKEYQEKIDIDTETVYTSSIHPFYDFSNKKWVESQEIDEINGLDHFGNLQLLKNDINYQSTEDKIFYDFTVNNYHNYFVGKNNKFVLTHNSATVFFPIWHQEIEDILVLKNNKGTEDNRVRKLDYAIQISRIFYERFIQDGEITLFSPHDVPGLYDSFGTIEFDSLYLGFENNTSIPKKTVKAQKLILDLLKERAETGRIYIMNIDHCNTHSSFIDKVNMSNLCVSGDTEITIEFYYGKDYVRKTISIKNLDGYINDSNYKDLKVFSYDIDNKLNTTASITAFAQTSPKAKVMRITDEESGKSIVVTPEHKVFTKNRGYLMAKDLTETDELVIN